MSSTPKTFVVTKRLMPDYYPEFHCRMGACAYTCCQGWNIDITKADYLKAKQATKGTRMEETVQIGMARRRLKGVGEERYAYIHMDTEGRCPMLEESGMCGLQLTCGEGKLPETCRTFPRMKAYTPGGYAEYACSTACEQVLYLLLQRPEGLGFIEEPIPAAERITGAFPVCGPILDIFPDLRELCVDILQDRRTVLPIRLLAIGLLVKELEGEAKAGRLDNLKFWLERKRAVFTHPIALEAVGPLQGNQTMFILNNLKILQNIETPIWDFTVYKQRILEEFSMKTPGEKNRSINPAFYRMALREMVAHQGDLSFLFENLLVNTLFCTKFPLAHDTEALWKDYVSLCVTYSFFCFFAVCCRPTNRDELVQALVLASRALLHDRCKINDLTNLLFQNDSATLAHMAILVQG